MIDTKKRTTLKVLGGSAIIATAPSLALAGGCKHGIPGEAHAELENIVVPVSSGAELTISLAIDPEPTIRLTNHSNKLIIVKHVHPGIVHAGELTFDINSIFQNSAYAIGAGTSRNVLIKPTYATQAETDFPLHLYRKQPQRIVAVTGRDKQGRLGNSTRSYFA